MERTIRSLLGALTRTLVLFKSSARDLAPKIAKFGNASNHAGTVSPTGKLAEWCREPQMRLLTATRLQPPGSSLPLTFVLTLRRLRVVWLAAPLDERQSVQRSSGSHTSWGCSNIPLALSGRRLDRSSRCSKWQQGQRCVYQVCKIVSWAMLWASGSWAMLCASGAHDRIMNYPCWNHQFCWIS